ncbi:MAG: 30S ribosomal protein S7 [Candidatus Micrarchaeota archaeon]|nr:MAG: 30S ribosomal protein S7 [Candidatus Micrarchaeota archaeon]
MAKKKSNNDNKDKSSVKEEKESKQEEKQAEQKAAEEHKEETNEQNEVKKERKRSKAEIKLKLFNKYDFSEVDIKDEALRNKVNLKPLVYPNTFRRRSQHDFSVENVNIVERLVNYMMRGGTGKKVGGKVIRTEGKLQGKKLRAIKIVRNAFEIIEQQTKQNPIQLLTDAISNSAPIESVTRVRTGGVITSVAVNLSTLKGMSIALRNIAHGAIISAFNNKTTLEEALAREIILAGRNDPNSYAVRRKNEIERIAKTAR